MKRFPKLFSLGFAALAALSIGHADASLVFDLNIDACTGGCGPAGTSFGTVTLTQVDADTQSRLRDAVHELQQLHPPF